MVSIILFGAIVILRGLVDQMVGIKTWVEHVMGYDVKVGPREVEGPPDG